MARVLEANRARGLSLAEALLSLGLVVVVILVTVALAITALRSNQKGSDQVVASSYGGKVIEKFVYGLPASTDPFWSTASFASPYQTDQIVLGNTEFQAQIFLADMAGVANGVKTVTVNVTWGSGAQGRTGYGSQVTSVTRLIYAH